ncbi:MAG: hypothetical protein GOVbin962_10 [Prokaryotic dsDNA virus sp.]|nr:MAG: hypothetical protein GOVbin962_10 [Prokaryotic dsDNA virus sp.]|tara:strand:- start:33338 stop:33535 length:198 start_codon:yes stop_codon:yes gene_type:complete
MKIINETNVKRKKYIVEFWFLHFIGDEDCGYDYDRVEVEAISPRQAILKAEQLAPRGAKKFEIVE